MSARGLKIIYDADGLIVVDKASGIPSSGRTLSDPHCVQSLLMTHFRRSRIWAVHQLDSGTSGLNLFVKRKALVSVWAERLTHAEKDYRAFVGGEMQRQVYTVTAPLGYCEKTRRHRVIASGRPAHSEVRVIHRWPLMTEVAVRISTGRTHQVRLHLEHLGHPVVGDLRYAPEAIGGMHHRLALHAQSIRFRDGLRFETQLPDDLVSLRN